MLDQGKGTYANITVDRLPDTASRLIGSGVVSRRNAGEPRYSAVASGSSESPANAETPGGIGGGHSADRLHQRPIRHDLGRTRAPPRHLP
jgi:hypothetical protein